MPPWATRRRALEVSLDRAAEHVAKLEATLPESERLALRYLLRKPDREGALARLASLPPAALLSPGDCETFERLWAEPAPEPPRSRPSAVLVMKATRLCNLRCTYCHSWRDGPGHVMPFEVLARATRDVFAIPGMRNVEFVWHGGEVTLLPPRVMRQAIWLQQQFRRPGHHVHNFIQTNGTMLSEEWLDLCVEFGLTVGVSLDGPPEIHDGRRVDVAGRGTSARARAGLQELRRRGIEHGVLLVVDRDVAEADPRRVLEFLVELGVGSVGFLNVIPDNDHSGPPRGAYLPWPEYVEWLREVYALWWRDYAGAVYLRELGDLAGKLVGSGPRTCFFAGDCAGRYLTIEPDGAVSACDKYVGHPGFVFGHLHKASLGDIAAGQVVQQVREHDRREADRRRRCRFFDVCQGGCPHDRALTARYVSADESCCGLAPLLEDMTRTLAAEGAPIADAPAKPPRPKELHDG